MPPARSIDLVTVDRILPIRFGNQALITIAIHLPSSLSQRFVIPASNIYNGAAGVCEDRGGLRTRNLRLQILESVAQGFLSVASPCEFARERFVA